MNVHGLCRKAGPDRCRIFHTESLSKSPQNEEGEKKKPNHKKDLLKSAAELKAIEATVTYIILVTTSIARIS